MRRPPTLVLIVLLITGAAFGANRSIDGPATMDARLVLPLARHFILSPARLLNEQEQADLETRGLIIEKALTGGRYLVRMTGSSTITSSDPRIATLTPLTADLKLHRSVLREVAGGRPYARLNIFFHDDVSFADAKAAIESAGGTLTEPLQHDFHAPHRIPARIATPDVLTLAADERVLLVYGPLNLQITPNNAVTAIVDKVAPLFTAPYNLTGQGVTLSYFELAEADATHPEFGGRLTTHGPFAGSSSSDRLHSTHVAGTMIAAGIDPNAKGMAPGATLNEYDAAADAFFDLKAGLSNLSVTADNNSWGYVLGWCNVGKCAGSWVWEDTDLYYGGYDALLTAPLDQIVREGGVLMVHSSGNDADKIGPTSPPFVHSHEDIDGNITTGYCYSAGGGGTDCPVPACKSGAEFCEKTRHPQITSVLPAPWMSVGFSASAKNVIAVGDVDRTQTIACFSSRGPARDGRVKPDIVARGGDQTCSNDSVYSTFPSNSYGRAAGTSMSAPVVTGVSALLVEQWRRTFGGATPNAAILKTLMLATAHDLGNAGPDYIFGFGLLDAKAAADTIIADAGQSRRIKIASMATGGRLELPLSVTSPQTLRVTLGWTDPEVLTFPVDSGDPTDPLAAATLVNDLDVKVIDTNGNDVLPYVLDPLHPEVAATRGANHVDNTEQVEMFNAPAGSYKVVVSGTSIAANSPQTFVLVTNAELGAAIVPCTDVNEPNDTEATAYGNLVSVQTVAGRTCTQSDVDYYKFLVDQPGTVSVAVTATDTPLRVTLSSSATAPVTVDVPVGTTRTVSTTYSGTTATTFFARVEPTGTIGATARYTITPTFPFGEASRRRTVRRTR